MSHPFLPKRKAGKEARFPVPAEPGIWDNRANSHLEALAETIEIPPAQQRIYSIPDPWARAILFDRALYDEEHLLHATVLGEWRGMLAMLALRERRGFVGLSASEVNLAAPPPDTFSAVLAQLHPSDANLISGDSNWSTFFVLRWQQQPFSQTRSRSFAFTSPTTLVCTGADYSSVLTNAEIPWFEDFNAKSQKGGLLADPIPHLSAREKKGVAEWLLILTKELTNARANASRRTWIIRMLGAFAKDLDPTANATGEDLLSASSLKLHHGVYRFLDKPRKSDANSVTDVEIVTTKTNAPKYLLIDSSIAQQWNENAREITVFRDINLATANSRLVSSSKESSGTLDGGYSWCTPEYFFSSRLIYEPNAHPAFPGCLPVKFTGVDRAKDVVLPLNKGVLELFTPHEIADRFTVEWLPDGGANCSLQLVLKSGDGQEKVCRIQKTYAPAAMTKILNLPLIASWPNFRLEGINWRTYYLFQFWSDDEEELSVEPWPEPPQLPDQPPPVTNRKHIIEKRRFRIYRTDVHPQALICATPYAKPSGVGKAMANGILLLQLPDVVQPPVAGAAVLGIDFGSTGSSVYMATGGGGDGGRKEPVIFRSLPRLITDFDPGRSYKELLDLFLPTIEPQTGKDRWPAENILSVFRDFGDPTSNGLGIEGTKDQLNRVILQDGHILYVDNPRQFLEFDPQRVISNLKWGEERETIAARDFLMQLCLQTAAELAVMGVNTVDIRFSYPTAFSKRDRDKFKAHWDAVTKKASALTGIQFILNKEVDCREAVTATRFFSDSSGSGERMDIGGGALTADIGGGTTDFAVWNKSALVAHSSVMLAGRDMFLTPLRRKPKVLTEIKPALEPHVAKLSEGSGAFNAYLDAIVSQHGESLIEALSIRVSRPSVQGLLSILEIGLCGLCFYAGLLVRRLVESGNFKYGKRIVLFAGGNGSKMFRWCALGSSIADSEIHERATNAFLTGADIKDVKVLIELSSRPKGEVAYGLVCTPYPDRPSPPDFARQLTGESFMVGSEIRPWDQNPIPEDITTMQVSANRNFPMFACFLGAIERRPSEDLWDQLGGYVDRRFGEQAHDIEKAKRKDPHAKAEDVIRNEPIFIMALKRYLEMEIDDWARRF